MARPLILNPPEVLELQEEISKHPELDERLATITDVETWFAEAGAYAEVLIDGQYDVRNDLPGLCRFITDKLYAKRTGVIITPAGTGTKVH